MNKFSQGKSLAIMAEAAVEVLLKNTLNPEPFL